MDTFGRERCPSCKGTGRVQNFSDEYTIRLPEAGEWVVCPQCRGHGWPEPNIGCIATPEGPIPTPGSSP